MATSNHVCVLGSAFTQDFDNQLSFLSFNFNGFGLQIVIKIISFNFFYDIKIALQDLLI